MTIADWTLLLDAVICVLLVSYGVWFRDVVKHQLRLKDATIETLESKISSLKDERAPAIAADYKMMKEHAETVTIEKQRLDEEKRTLDRRVRELSMIQGHLEAFHQIDVYRAESEGLRNATKLLLNHFGEYVAKLEGRAERPTGGLSAWFIAGTSNIIETLQEQDTSRLRTFQSMVSKLRYYIDSQENEA